MPSLEDLAGVWLVGVDGFGQPALRACHPSEVVGLIGAAAEDHGHDITDITGLDGSLSSLAGQVSTLLARVSAIESQLSSGPTYSPAVNQFLQSTDAPAMRQAMGISGIQLGEFGQVLMTATTVAQAYAPIEEYLEGRNNG